MIVSSVEKDSLALKILRDPSFLDKKIKGFEDSKKKFEAAAEELRETKSLKALIAESDQAKKEAEESLQKAKAAAEKIMKQAIAKEEEINTKTEANRVLSIELEEKRSMLDDKEIKLDKREKKLDDLQARIEKTALQTDEQKKHYEAKMTELQEKINGLKGL